MPINSSADVCRSGGATTSAACSPAVWSVYSRRRDCHSAAPPSPLGRWFNRDGEGGSAKRQNSRRRLQVGPIADAFSPRAIFIVCVPLAAQVLLPALWCDQVRRAASLPNLTSDERRQSATETATRVEDACAGINGRAADRVLADDWSRMDRGYLPEERLPKGARGFDTAKLAAQPG